MLVKGFSKGIYVTTSDGFSKEARSTPAAVLTRDAVTTFDLVDRSRFFSMLNVVRPRTIDSRRGIFLQSSRLLFKIGLQADGQCDCCRAAAAEVRGVALTLSVGDQRKIKSASRSKCFGESF
jgi:hypothetical protein